MEFVRDARQDVHRILFQFQLKHVEALRCAKIGFFRRIAIFIATK